MGATAQPSQEKPGKEPVKFLFDDEFGADGARKRSKLTMAEHETLLAGAQEESFRQGFAAGKGEMSAADQHRIAAAAEQIADVVVNTPKEAEFAGKIAGEIVSEGNVRPAVPVMGAEDFAFMLQKRPGAFIFMGNGDSANLHHPAYDFNDKAIPFGTSYWVRLVENAMPA
jgi:metal-dependent amidase/aminoacylase/carboxypeptidase family protein